MGKSKKKSATKVAAPPVAVPKSGSKGKRGAENKIEKTVSAKKQKLERDETVLAKQKADKEQPKKPAISTSVDDSDASDSGSEPKVVAKKTPIPAKNGSVVTKEKPVAKKQSAADNNSAAVSKTPAASETSESDGDDDDAKPASAVSNVARKAASSGDSSEGDGDLSMEENVIKVAHAAAPKGKVESSESGSVKEKNSSDSNEETKANRPKPKTQETPAAIVSKILYVGNLSFSVEESDVRAFFKNAGEMVDVRFSINSKGKFRGFGHVEFATVEAAQKAMELNDQELLGRSVRLGYAPERPDFTPKLRAQTASVRGFDTSLGEDEIRSALQEHFRSCGEITSIYFSPDYESGGVKKMAYMDFVYRSGLEAALQKDKSDLGGCFYLNVQEAKSKGDNAGGRLDRGGKSGGGRGGREGGRGGRFSGRGGRGKKKTFWDD